MCTNLSISLHGSINNDELTNVKELVSKFSIHNIVNDNRIFTFRATLTICHKCD